MTGGWGAPRAKPPSNDPERPPKGLASGSLANPARIQVTCYHCCGNHAGCTAPTEETTDEH